MYDEQIISRDNIGGAIDDAIGELPDVLQWAVNPRKAGEDHVILEVTAPRETIDIEVIVRSFRKSLADLMARGFFTGDERAKQRRRLKADGETILIDIIYIVGVRVILQRRVGVDRVVSLKRAVQSAVLDVLAHGEFVGVMKDDQKFVGPDDAPILPWQR